jgi:hypothetical protein
MYREVLCKSYCPTRTVTSVIALMAKTPGLSYMGALRIVIKEQILADWKADNHGYTHADIQEFFEEIDKPLKHNKGHVGNRLRSRFLSDRHKLETGHRYRSDYMFRVPLPPPIDAAIREIADRTGLKKMQVVTRILADWVDAGAKFKLSEGCGI